MSIYHLHVPRTSGVYIRENLINSFQDSNNFVGHTQEIPVFFRGFDNVSGHFANNPIHDIDKTFAVVRNPIELTFSYIQYMRDSFYPNLTFDEVFNKYKQENILDNFANINIKFLTGFIKVNNYNRDISDLRVMAESCWHVNVYCHSVEEAISHIEQNNIKIFKYEDPYKYNKISNLYGKNLAGARINESSHLDKEVFERLYDEVANLNNLDLELYAAISKYLIDDVVE